MYNYIALSASAVVLCIVDTVSVVFVSLSL